METTNSTPLIITRTFNAPVSEIWLAWTDPAHAKKWWGPEGFTAPTIKMDLRVGGKYLFCMRDPEGKDYWSTGAYREIVPQKRLVITDSFSDENGNVISAESYGMSGMPLELLVTVTFEDQGDETKMTLKHEGLPEAMLEPCRVGWEQSFDKLEDSL